MGLTYRMCVCSTAVTLGFCLQVVLRINSIRFGLVFNCVCRFWITGLRICCFGC